MLFHVTNFSKSKSLYKEGMSPIFRNAVTAGSDGDDTTGGKAHHTDTQNAGGGSTPQPWERVHPKSVFYYRAKDGLSGGDRLKRLETDRDRTGDDARESRGRSPCRGWRMRGDWHIGTRPMMIDGRSSRISWNLLWPRARAPRSTTCR